MWEDDRAGDGRGREANLAWLRLFDTASGFDVEHEDASNTGFAVYTNLPPLKFGQFARDEQAESASAVLFHAQMSKCYWYSGGVIQLTCL